MPTWLIKFIGILLLEYKNIRETTPDVQSPCKILICNFKIYGVHLLLASGKICTGQYKCTSQVMDLGEAHDLVITKASEKQKCSDKYKHFFFSCPLFAWLFHAISKTVPHLLIWRRLVCDAEVKAKEFPGTLLVEHNVLGTNVAVDHLDRVVQECQSLTHLSTQNTNERAPHSPDNTMQHRQLTIL